MLAEAQAIQEQLVQWRRTIHQWPELGFDVQRTAALVAETLAGLGVEIRTGVGKSGVVAYLGDGGGPVIGVRADMDALPIHEENAVPYASQAAGKMHACGHDGHTAMLLGVATLLSRRSFPGQVRLLFQPSEEGGYDNGVSGAPRMIEDGALDGVDAVIALHVHGQTIDPIWLTSQVLNALYALPSRRISPLQPSVVTVGVVRGGTADNVIPASVHLEGTLRSFDGGVRQQLVQDVERALEIVRAFGGDYDLRIERGYPPLVNHAAAAGWLRSVAGDLLGQQCVAEGNVSMGAEDFAFMTQRAPGAMFALGVKPPGGEDRYLHTPTFDLDEDALPIGTAILAETALRYVRGEFNS